MQFYETEFPFASLIVDIDAPVVEGGSCPSVCWEDETVGTLDAVRVVAPDSAHVSAAVLEGPTVAEGTLDRALV